MLSKWVDAAWPLFVAFTMTAVYAVFTKYGWSRADSIAFASFSAFATIGVLFIMAWLIPNDAYDCDDDFLVAVASSAMAGCVGMTISVIAAANWPIVLPVAIVAFITAGWIIDRCDDEIGRPWHYPTIGEDWLRRKSLTPVALVLGSSAMWVLEFTSTVEYGSRSAYGLGLTVCGVVLLVQFLWTVARWPAPEREEGVGSDRI